MRRTPSFRRTSPAHSGVAQLDRTSARGGQSVIVIAALGVSAYIAIKDWVTIESASSDLAQLGLQAEVGVGLIITAIASVAGAVAALGALGTSDAIRY